MVALTSDQSLVTACALVTNVNKQTSHQHYQHILILAYM